MSRHVKMALVIALGTVCGVVVLQWVLASWSAVGSDGLTHAERMKKHAAGAPSPEDDPMTEMTSGAMPLDIESPGITDAKFITAAEADLPDHVRVMGVEVDGQFRAYLVEGMAEFDQHLVHDEINGRQISVVYCDKTDTCRAFDRADFDEETFLMGGWSGKQLLLKLGTDEYELDSDKIPLSDYPLQRMTWGEWKKAHPDSLLFEGHGWDG